MTEIFGLEVFVRPLCDIQNCGHDSGVDGGLWTMRCVPYPMESNKSFDSSGIFVVASQNFESLEDSISKF